MNDLQRAYRYCIAEPFYWIFLAFFQPARFQRKYEIPGWRFWRRIVPMLRLLFPMFLLSYPIALIVHFILVLLHIAPYQGLASFFIIATLGIVGGIVAGIVFGIAFRITEGIELGLVVGITLAIMLGRTSAVVGSIVGGLMFGLIFGLVEGRIENIRSGILAVFMVGLAGVIIGIFIGSPVVNPHTFSLTEFITSGLAGSISCFLGFLIGYFRLPLYLASGPSSMRVYWRSLRNPSRVFDFLQHSSLHWDERVYLPLPLLVHTLLIACNEDPKRAFEELRYIATERPQQLFAAVVALLELIIRDLERRTTLVEIANAAVYLDNFVLGNNLMDVQLSNPLTRLSNASVDAQRYLAPVSRQAKSDALKEMMKNLQAIYPNVAFRDQQLNRRLGQVVAAWMEVAQKEQQELERLIQKLGKLDNPYVPGIVLPKTEDNLFVGRRDIAEQLEIAFRVLSNHPTFLLNGERRMGKTSTLVQLPRLLGSRYIPVFYNLQKSDIYVNTPIFLEWLASGIQQALESPYAQMKMVIGQGRRGNRRRTSQPVSSTPTASSVEDDETYETLAYYELNQWLAEVEMLLEKDDKILLLTFDEFEMLEKVGGRKQINLSMLLDWFRDMIQFHPRIALLFSGVNRLEEMGNLSGLSWVSYFINVRTLHIGLLRAKDARLLITQPTAAFPGNEVYNDTVVDAILHETGGHPFLVQAVCSALIDHLNVEQRIQADADDVEAAIRIVLDSAWSSYFYEQWERTDVEQRTCLAVLLDESADLAHIEQQSGLEKELVRRTLQMLQRRDLVHQPQNGTYQMTLPMLGRWIRENG